nr:MAG TPA: hypothetical protein [Caudoviricetes sp.]
MGGGLAPAFSVLCQRTIADNARPKAMTASTMAVHLKKLFTCSPPLKSYLKTCPRSYPRGGCASCPVYPLTRRAVLALSQTRSGVGCSAPGSFSFVLPSFSFSFSSFDITILARLDFFCKWPAPFCF